MSGDQNAAEPVSLFNRDLIAKRLSRAWQGTPDFVTQLTLDDLAERLQIIKRPFEKAAIIGPEPRALPESIQSADGMVHLERFSTLVEAAPFPLLDPENMAFPSTQYDLIVSVLDLQIINDVPGFLTQLRRHLKPDGLLLAAAIGGNSLSELRAAWLIADSEYFGGAYARVAPFIDVKNAGALLQRTGYALPVADVETHMVRYPDPLALMAELRASGASNPMRDAAETLTTRNLLGAVVDAYPLDEDERISATLEIIWVSGWAPHDNQQKPLAPGSAEVSLTKVLTNKA